MNYPLLVPPPPPAIQDMRAGTQLLAGMGVATVLPDADFETYSEAGFVWDEETGKWVGPPGAPGNKKGINVVGADAYIAHPTFEILCLSYDLKDGIGKRLWWLGLPTPADLMAHVAAGGLLEAWNAGFERKVWRWAVARLGWTPMHPRQWRCAMAKARAFALPGALEKAGAVLNLPIKKDAEGKRLLTKFAQPRKPTKTDPRTRVLPVWRADYADALARYGSQAPTLPAYGGPSTNALTVAASAPVPLVPVKVLAEDHADTRALGHYCVTDIAAEAEASARIPDLTGEEFEWWMLDQAINDRGVHVDRIGLENCATIIRQAHARYNAELLGLTGIDAASKVQQLVGWLAGQGVAVASLDEEAVEDALQLPYLPPQAKRVLEIRAAIGSASVKKVFAMLNRMGEGDRLRDLYIYFGARTGRATGEGPQPTNLPKAGPDTWECGKRVLGEFVADSGCGKYLGLHHTRCVWCGRVKRPDQEVCEWNPDVAEQALAVIASRALAWVEHVYGDAMLAVAGVLRGLFDAAPGHDLISTDYNSIEAIGLAFLSGEEWRKEVFRTHGKIYETSASRMYGVPFEDFAAHKKQTGQHHPLRQKGKIGELAFGYQGWIGAAVAFDMPGTEDEIKKDILAWRAASPSVEWLWGGQTQGKANGVRVNAGLLAWADKWDAAPFMFGVEGMAISAVLSPNVNFPVMRLDGSFSGITFVMRGDILYCWLPSGRPLHYHAPRLRPGRREGEQALSYEGNNTNPKNGPMGWIRMDTWGGRLVENINQAVCRDLLRFACLNLEPAGYPVVLHVYDEIVSEIPEGFGSIEEFEQIVTRVPQWAHDWPVRAPGGWRAKRYRKG